MDLASMVFLPLKAAFSVAVLYGFYRFVLRKETHFAINRAFLLLAVLVSVITPFITITIIQNVVMDQVAPSVTVLESSQSMGAPLTAYDQPLSPIEMVGVAYLTITGCMLLRLLLILLKFILSVSRNSRRETINGSTVLVSNSYSQTFSFFGVVVMPESDFQRADRHLLVAHEQVHSRQLHSIDLLLAELFIAIQWFNPISYLLRDSLHEVHEYLADRCVIRGGADQLSYKRLLLDCITTANMPTLSSSFSAKLSKRRFAMISKTYNSGNQKYKFLLALPIAVALFALFSLKVEAKYVYTQYPVVEVAYTTVAEGATVTNAPQDFSAVNKLVEVRHTLNSDGTVLKDFIDVAAALVFIGEFVEQVSPIFSNNKTLRLQVDEPTLNFRNREGLQQPSIKELIQNCIASVPGGGFLKDFSFEKVQPTEERKYSLVLSAGNKYCIASSLDANISTPAIVTVYTKDIDGIEREVKSRMEFEGRVTKQMYDIQRTAVYHLTVTNGISKPFDMGAVLFAIGQFEVNQPTKSLVESGEITADAEKESDETFFTVEDMPTFNNQGINHAREYIQKNIVFPEAIKATGIKGNVYVSFVVNEEGKVITVKIVRSLQPTLDKEAVRVISEMPNWTPGKQRGKAVKVAFTIPVSFE